MIVSWFVTKTIFWLFTAINPDFSALNFKFSTIPLPPPWNSYTCFRWKGFKYLTYLHPFSFSTGFLNLDLNTSGGCMMLRCCFGGLCQNLFIKGLRICVFIQMYMPAIIFLLHNLGRFGDPNLDNTCCSQIYWSSFIFWIDTYWSAPSLLSQCVWLYKVHHHVISSTLETPRILYQGF